MPTLAAVTGAKYPAEFNGRPVPAPEGLSLAPIFGGRETPRTRPLFWSWGRERAVADGRWRAIFRRDKWALYDTYRDRTETADLSAGHAEILDRLVRDWQAWAERVGAG